MWLWLLSLLFDQTVTTENTRCLDISGLKHIAALLLAVVHQLYDIIYRRNSTFFFFFVNHTAFIYSLLIGNWKSYMDMIHNFLK